MSKRSSTTPKKTPEDRQQERRARFVKLAEKRVRNALKALNNVVRCGNKAAYSYTDEEAEKISSTLYDAAVAVRDAFTSVKNEKHTFTL